MSHPYTSYFTPHTSYFTVHLTSPQSLPVDGDIVPDQPAVEVIILPSPPVEAVTEAVDGVERHLVQQDDPPTVLGVAQPVAPPGHRHSHVENMRASLNKLE